MAKKNKYLEFLMWVIGIIVSVGIAGLFINGTFTTVFLLKLLPLIVHQIVGWVILISVAIGAFLKIKKAL